MQKEVVIIGDGPSIRHYDLSSINSEVEIICCGNQIFHKNFKYISNNKLHYIVVEPRLLWPSFILRKKRNHVKSIKPIVDKMIAKFKEFNGVNYYLHWSNIPFIFSSSNLHFVSNKQSPFTIKLDSISGSFRACVSLASFLGYNKIHLLGFDSFVLHESPSNRWYERNATTFKNYTKKVVQSIIDYYSHIEFNVISEKKLVLTSNQLLKSDLKIRYNKNRNNLNDIMDQKDIELFNLSNEYNMDV